MELEDGIVFLTKGITEVRRACKASHGGSRGTDPAQPRVLPLGLRCLNSF